MFESILRTGHFSYMLAPLCSGEMLNGPYHAFSRVDVFEEADLVAGKLCRTLLARVAPGSPDGRATQLLGTDNT